MPTPPPLTWPIVALCAAVSLAGCKIQPTPTEESKAAAAAKAFNPDRMVQDIWETKALPYLKEKTGSFQDVSTLAGTDAEAAGAKYGNTKKQANSPWTFVATAQGKIVAANTKSRAATIDIDVNADGKADLRVQIGPAMRGTALRDSLDFVNFNDFTNQIDFAQFGKSFNTHVNRTILSRLPREALEGRTAKVLGAYIAGSGDKLPLMTPATAEIGPKP